MRTTLVASAVGAVVIVLTRGALAEQFFKEPRLEQALLWIALAVIPFTMARVVSGALRALKDIKRFVLGFDVAYRIARLGAFFVLYLLGLKLLGIVGASVVASLVALFVLWRFLQRRGGFLTGPRAVDPAPIATTAVVAYSLAMLADGSMAFAMQHSDRLILGFFLSSADVGIYNIGALIASLMTFVLFSFNAIFSSVIADVYHRDRMELLQSLFRSVTRWVIVLTLPIYRGILAAGEATLGIFGPEFVRGYAPLAILATGQMVAAGTGSVGICLAMTGHQKYNVYNALAMAIVGIALNLFLIPRLGIAGAGIATGVAYVFVNLLRLIEVRLLLGITPYDRSTLRVVATGVIGIAAVLAFRRFVGPPEGPVWSVATFVAGAGLVAAVTAAMGIREEDRFIFATVMKRIGRRKGAS